MKKTIWILTILALLSANFGWPETAKAAPLTKENAYQGIVKIKTYLEDRYHNLRQYGSGSGVVISADGLVITNYHVVIAESIDKTLRLRTTLKSHPEERVMEFSFV